MCVAFKQKVTGNHPETPETEAGAVPEDKGRGVDPDGRLLRRWGLSQPHSADSARRARAEPW